MTVKPSRNWKVWSLPILVITVAGLTWFGLTTDLARLWRPENPQEATQREAEQRQQQQEEQQKKLGYEMSDPVVLPGVPEAPQQLAKPGHWTAVAQQMQVNLSDFVGQSRTAVTDQQGIVYPLEHTPFVLLSTRPVTLTKGRPKQIESTFFVPEVDRETNLAIELKERGLGYSIRPQPAQLTPMPSYQYYFVVLAKEPSRYAFVKSLDSVIVPFDGETEADDPTDTLHYQVALPIVSRSIPLPDNPLTWTSIAYILWDEVDPQHFTPEQRQAMIDWLHWGGQLVINGPASLDLLRGSFLEPYLPATSQGARDITTADLAELNGGWTVSSGEPLAPNVPWSGIELQPSPEAQPLPSTGELLVERRVGRGRIVVSAMQLSEREFVNWRSGYESLFNACLLRRPPRVYREGYFGDLTLAWADKQLAGRRLDSRLTTGLRHFARDLGVNTTYQYVDVLDDMANPRVFPGSANQATLREYRPPDAAGGIGSWNDFSAAASAARGALKQEAGIDVPGASFVVLYLIVYLIALVPLNWMVFNALRRVEWAWLAAPVIAVGCTFLVVHQARLDIGFVRAQTEIGLLELQPDYARGHLARYTALYTSLSTTYDLEFDDLSALAAPFPTRPDFELLTGQSPAEVLFQRYDNVRLTGLPILSNSTSMVHSEQMFGLEGPIRLGVSRLDGRERIENRSQFHLRSVGVLRRQEEGRGTSTYHGPLGMWIGDLPPGESAPVAFVPLNAKQGEVPFAAERTAEARRNPGDALDLEPLFRLAYDGEDLQPGEVRLAAQIDGVLPGETISPAASQVRGATLVVAHLRYGPLPAPRPDRNTRQNLEKD